MGHELAVCHPRAHAAHHDSRIGVGQVDFDLLQPSSCYKTAGRGNDRPQPTVSQAGRHTDQGLFGNPDIDKPVGKAPFELDEIARPNGIAAYHNHALVRSRHLGDRRCERVPAVDQGRGLLATTSFIPIPPERPSIHRSREDGGAIRPCHS